MIAVGTRALAQQRRRPIPVMDSTFYKGEWMEAGEDPRLSPTVFLAEQPPDYNLAMHFHRQNQFQLFVAGSAHLGREPLSPVTVHYAGAYTGYGPLLSGPQGLQYFTIRPVFDTGMIPATEAREKMVRGPKRHTQTVLGEPWSEERLQALVQPEDRFAIAPDRGLAVRHVRLPPSCPFELAQVAHSIGLFMFVLSGTADTVGQTLTLWESVFASVDEQLTLRAGPRGAEIVLLHVPPTEAAYQR